MTRTWWEQSSTHPLPPMSYASNGRAASAQPDSQDFTKIGDSFGHIWGDLETGNWSCLKTFRSRGKWRLIFPGIGMGVSQMDFLGKPEEMVVFVTIQRMGIRTNKHGLTISLPDHINYLPICRDPEAK